MATLEWNLINHSEKTLHYLLMHLAKQQLTCQPVSGDTLLLQQYPIPYIGKSQLLGEYKANRKIRRWLKIHVGWLLTCKSGKRQGNVFDEKVRGFVLDSHATCTLP